jgi:hypothetical protein
LYDVADTCWGEYIACLFSASVHPEQAKLFDMPLLSLLPKAKDVIADAKTEWLVDHEIGKFWQRAGGTLYSLLKYFSYLIGHAAGLGNPASEIASEVWTLLEANAWLLTWVEKVNEELSRMLETFDDWKGTEAFEPLKNLVRGLFDNCGISLSDSNGRLYISVRTGK